MTKINYAEHLGKSVEDYTENIGKRVAKVTLKKHGNPKPFKSKSKINTVKGVILHPTMSVPAYTFLEDDSYVECRRCQLVTDGEDVRMTINMDITVLKNAVGVDRYSKDTVFRLYNEGLAKLITESGRKYLALAIDQNQKIAAVHEITIVPNTDYICGCCHDPLPEFSKELCPSCYNEINARLQANEL